MGGEECIYAMSTETSAATAAATEIRRAGAASVLQMLTPHDVDSHLVPLNRLRRQLALDHLLNLSLNRKSPNHHRVRVGRESG